MVVSRPRRMRRRRRRPLWTSRHVRRPRTAFGLPAFLLCLGLIGLGSRVKGLGLRALRVFGVVLRGLGCVFQGPAWLPRKRFGD